MTYTLAFIALVSGIFGILQFIVTVLSYWSVLSKNGAATSINGWFLFFKVLYISVAFLVSGAALAQLMATYGH